MPREFTPEELGIQQKEFTPEELGIIKPNKPIVSAKKPEDEGFFHGIYESGKQGIESFKDIASGYGLGASRLFDSPEETKKKMDAIKAEAAKPNDFNQLSFADLERIKKDKGLLSALGQVPKYAAEALAGSAPQSAVPLAVGSAATALALPITGPFAPVVGALAGMGAYGLQQLGSNLNVQGRVRERPEDIDVGKAITASAIQAPLGYLADKFTLGLGGMGSKGVIAIGTELAARKAAGELGALGVARGVASQAVKGASQGFIAEAPTEALEQVLERWQAGQPLLDDEAKQAYKEAFFSAGASGGLGGAASRGIQTYSEFKQPVEDVPANVPVIKTPEATNLPSKEEQIQHEVAQDTHINPFGNVHHEELNPDLTDIIHQDRELNNKPHLKSYSLEDIADALLQTNEPNTHLDDILTKKISDLTQEAPEIVEQKASLQTPDAVTAFATSKGIDTASQGYNDFLARSTGATDLSAMSPMQLHAAHTAISQVTNPELPEGTNAKRFTNDQYQAAISTLPPQTEITSVIPHIVSTGVSLPEAKAIEAHAFKMGDLEVEGNTVSPAGVSSVFGERPNIKYQPFKQSTVPTAFEVNGKTYNTEAEALQEQQFLEKARLSELALAKKGISSAEKEIARHVAEKEKQDVALATLRLNGKDVGHPQYDLYKKAIADVVHKRADDYIAPLQAQLELHQANLERHQNPVEITPSGEQPVYQDRHVLYGQDEQGVEVPVASFDTRQEAERHVINQQNKDTLQELIDSTDTGSQVERLKQYAQARIQELQGEAPTGGFTPEAQAKVDAIQKTLIPQLQKFGLNNVGVRIVNAINNGTADGEYVNKLINIAYDAENPMGTLRHETIHALKDLGAFTDKEWAILKKKAQDEWIQTYIVNENLFEAYQNAHLKQVGSMKGFEEMIEEEAIAEAFKHFAVGKKPSGIIGNIFNRISKLFEAIRRAFTGQGFNSPDKIFQGIEEGEYAGRTEGQGQSKYSFIRKAVPNESEISTQNPTGQNRPYNPITDMLSIDEASVREAMEAKPELRQRVINAIRGYGFIPANIAEEDVIPTFKRNIINNLLFLYKKVPPDIRARSKLWYDGANRIANDLAKVYNISPEQVSGILAAMSPQKDWFQNVSMAERAIDILTKRGEMSWTPEMLQYAESYINETDKREIKEKRRREFENTISPSADKQIKLKDMDETSAAAFIRAYDEAFNTRDYRIVTPEGGFAGLVTKNDGTSATMTWSTYGPIKKTVSIFRKPSRVNISNKLGTEHKIRSFYNNIIAPNSDISHVTMDTHAVAAALFEALAGSDAPVSHNFGGTGKNKNLGVGGTYGIIADAYREAAELVHIKPRELQSITWEAVRGLFNEDIKTSLQKKIPAEWDKYKQGLVSFDDARNTILGLAQSAIDRKITDNIKEPDWVGSGRGDYVSEGGASYDKSFVPEGGVRLRKESEIRENLKINLSAASKSIPGLNELYNRANKGDTEAYELLQKVAEARLKFLVGQNAKVVVEYSKNVNKADREPSINATVSFKESNSQPVLAALAQFADSFNQEQIHVRQKTAFPFMHDFGDGSYATAVYKIELNEALSDKEISNIISESGLNGFNLTKKTLTAYWVDPKEKSNDDFLRFKDQITRVVELVGNATGRPKPAIERLTIYGKGQRELSSIRGDILTAQASDTVTPKLIAQFINKQPVTTFKQKDLTKSQISEQRALAKIFEDLPMNDLKNPLVMRAYHALTKALVEQYKVLPIKVNVMANVGIDDKAYAYGGRDTTALKEALTKGLTSAQADEAIQYLKDHYGVPDPKWDSGILSTIKPFKDDPYGNLSVRVKDDVSKNNQLMVYKTSPATFGPSKSSFKSHPLLRKSGLVDVNGYPMLYNDILRAVHDYYAHNLSDATFGPKGEFAAAKNHMATTMDPLARWALIAETRLQNAWQNFREGKEHLSNEDKGFAVQKAALPPVQFALTGDAKIDAPMKAFIETLTPEQRKGSLPEKSKEYSRYSLRAPNTPEFKRWFGNSKVVDENGNPKVMYHGTARNITVFKPKQANAIFLTDKPDFAKTFAETSDTHIVYEKFKELPLTVKEKVMKQALKLAKQNGIIDVANAKFAMQTALTDGNLSKYGIDWHLRKFMEPYLDTGENIMPVFVRAEKPFDFAQYDEDSLNALLNNSPEVIGKYQNKLDKYTLSLIANGSWEQIEKTDVQNRLKDLKFDSFYVKEKNVKNLAVFDSSQIKSAIGNVGTYDETNPDIRYALRKKLPPVPINNAPPRYLTKLTNPQSTSQKIGNTFKEMKGTFNDNEWWTKKRAEWIDPSALITRHVQNKGVFDNGQLRADLLLRGASQTMNIVNNGLQSGLPELNTDSSIIIKRSEKNLARSQVLADALDANPIVRAAGTSGRMFVQEVARAKRGEEIIAEDNKTIADGHQELADAKQLLMQAKVAPNFTARTKLFKQSQAMRESGNKKIKTKRELQVTPEQIAWADQQIKNVPELKEIFDIWRTNNASLMTLWEDTGLVSKANADYYRSKKHYVPLTMADEDIEELAGDNFGYAGPRGAKTAKELHILKGADITRNLWENMYKNYAAKLSAAYENQTRKVAVEQLASVGAASISDNPHKDANVINLRYKDWKNPLADKSGTVHAIVANPNDVLAFQNMHYELTPLMKFMSGVTKVLRTGALLNPMFWIRQLVRDPIHSTIVTDSGLVTPFHSAKEFVNILRKNSREYDILFERGVVGPRDSTVDIHDFLSQVGEESSDKGLLSSAIRNVEKIHEASDAATRISVFKQAEAKAIKELKMTPEDAINYATMKARESINFSVHGNSAMLNNLRHMIPFFSASITSLDTVYRASTGYGLPPKEKAAAKRLFQQRAAIMVVLSTVYAMMMQGDDEYKKQPDYVKDNNWLIPNPFGTGFIKAPVPFEVGFLFKTIPETTVRYMAGTSTGKEVLASYQTGVLQNIPGSGLPLPQAFKPLLEVITNHSFFRNGPIETRADEDLPTYLRGEDKSSEVARILSRFGLDSINLSPVKIDYLIQAYTAELGTFTTGLVDGVVRTVEGKSTPETSLEKMPFFKAFMTDPNADRAVGVFYDLTHNSKEVADAFNKLVREGHSNEAQEYIQEHRKEYVLHSPLEKIGREMAKIKKVITIIKENESISPEERRARIDHLTSVYNKMAENGVAIARRINP